MANQQLVDYIRSQVALGVTKDDLKKAINVAGWSAADTEAAFAVTEGRVPIAPPVSKLPPVQQPRPVQPLQPIQPVARPVSPAQPDMRPLAAARSMSTPRWVWIAGGIVAVVVVLAAIIYFVPGLRDMAAWYLAGAPAPTAPVEQPIVPVTTPDVATTTATSTTPVATSTASTTTH